MEQFFKPKPQTAHRRWRQQPGLKGEANAVVMVPNQRQSSSKTNVASSKRQPSNQQVMQEWLNPSFMYNLFLSLKEIQG